MIRYVLALLLAVSCQSVRITEPATSLDDFRAHLERLRIDGHSHAMSAVIVKDQAIAWTGSFGGDDARPVSDTTVFHLASLTKPFASMVILQLVDEGKVSLDDPVSKYGIILANSGNVLIRHLMSHTYLTNVAPGYTWNGRGFVPTAYETSFSSAAGMTASALDYAAFSMAMDRDAFLQPATRTLAWTPVVGP